MSQRNSFKIPQRTDKLQCLGVVLYPGAHVYAYPHSFSLYVLSLRCFTFVVALPERHDICSLGTPRGASPGMASVAAIAPWEPSDPTFPNSTDTVRSSPWINLSVYPLPHSHDVFCLTTNEV